MRLRNIFAFVTAALVGMGWGVVPPEFFLWLRYWSADASGDGEGANMDPDYHVVEYYG